MYTVENIIQTNYRAAGKELKAELEKVGMSYTYDLTDANNMPMADEPVMRKNLERAVTLNWWAELDIEIRDQFTDVDLKHVSNLPTPSETGAIFASKGLGFSDLRPGEKVEIKKNENLLNQLIRSSVATRIRIYDGEQLIWDPVEVPITWEAPISPKAKNEGKMTKFTGVKIGNRLHPNKAREAYYPTATEEKTTAKKETKTSSIVDQMFN